MEGTIHRRNRTHVQLWQVVHGGSCTGSYWGLRHRHILHRHGIELIHPCRTNRGMTIMFQAYLDSLDRISQFLYLKNKTKIKTVKLNVTCNKMFREKIFLHYIRLVLLTYGFCQMDILHQYDFCKTVELKKHRTPTQIFLSIFQYS